VYYVIVLAPVLGAAQSGPQLVADRYSYLSCLSWAALFGGIFFCWLQSAKSARVTAAAVVILISAAGLGMLTRAQVGVWHDAESLWQHTLRVTPNTAIANYNLGKVYETNGKAQDSVELYRRAVSINPTYAEAHYNLARLLGQQGKIDEAMAHYREALKFKSDDVETHNNLGQLLAMQGNFTAALTEYRKALATNRRMAREDGIDLRDVPAEEVVERRDEDVRLLLHAPGRVRERQQPPILRQVERAHPGLCRAVGDQRPARQPDPAQPGNGRPGHEL
jgi:tetratricopeptide (TPR) repeat protein